VIGTLKSLQLVTELTIGPVGVLIVMVEGEIALFAENKE
jgi:hypothetical protein